MKVVFKNVLCTTDLSNFSNMSVYYGAALTRVFEATLHLCHVIDLPIVSVHGEAFTYPPITRKLSKKMHCGRWTLS